MLGFSLQSQYDRPLTEIIPLLQSAGFCAVSPARISDFAALAACVKVNNMFIQSIHAPTQGIPLLWQPDNQASYAPQKAIFQSLADCARYGVPVLVLHGWQGLGYPLPAAEPDFRFFDRLVEEAKRLGVSVAFENLEGEEYHRALLIRYQAENHVGFCWDSGHDRCYPHARDYLEDFGGRLIMTHLNDNLGVRSPDGSYTTKDDLHYLPGDGNTDWDSVIDWLSRCRKQQIMNFELKQRTRMPADDLYNAMTTEQFIAEAGRRARLIAEKYNTL